MTTTSAANQRQRQSPLVYLLSVGLLILLMWLVGSCLSGLSTLKPAGTPAVDIGHEGHAQSADGSVIPYALTADDLKSVIQAQVVGDKQVFRTLFAKGRIGALTSGSRVLVTDGDWVSPKVHISGIRVIDGQDAGVSGWIVSDTLVP